MSTNVLYFKYNNIVESIDIEQNIYGDIDKNSLKWKPSLIDFLTNCLKSNNGNLIIWLKDFKGNSYNEKNIKINKISLSNDVDFKVLNEPDIYKIFLDYTKEVVSPKYIYDCKKMKMFNVLSNKELTIEEIKKEYLLKNIARKIETESENGLYLVE